MTAPFRTQTLIDYEDEIAAASWRRFIHSLLMAAAVLSMVIAAVALIAYLVIALQWQNRPFIGVFFSTPDLIVEDARPFSDAQWSGLRVGLKPGDQLLSVNGIRLPPNERSATLRRILDGLVVGDVINIRFQPDQDHQVEAGRCNELGCQIPSMRLQSFSTIDFVLYFGVGYICAVLVWVLGAVVLFRRSDTRAARLFTVSAAALSIFLAGRFDTFTSFELAPLWMFASHVFAAAVFSFALTFPYDVGLVRRLPIVRYVSFVVALALGILMLLYYDEMIFREFHNLAFAMQILAVTGLVAIMVWRWRSSTSALMREQVVFVGAGAVVAFVPTFLWTAVFALSGGREFIHEMLPVTYGALLLYALSFGYACLQYHLLQTDKIIPEFIIYSALIGLLLLGYFLVTLGLSLLGIEALSATNPLLVAATIGAIVLFFNPLRTYIRGLIDLAMFQQQTNYQERSESFARSLTNAVNMEDVFARIKRELDETVAPSQVFMFIYDSKLNIYRALPPTGSSTPPTDVTFDRDSGLVKYLQGEQSVLYLEPGQPLPLQVAPDRSRLGILGTPLLMSLRGSDKLNGLLAIGMRLNKQPYSYEDLRFLENIVDQAALSVERARFVDDLEQQVLYQEVVSKVSNALNFGIDFDTLLELVFAQTSRVVDADHFYVVSYDQEANELYHSFYSLGDDRFDSLQKYRWRLEDGVIAEVIKKQAPVLVREFSQEQARRNPTYKQPGDKPIHAWVGVPMATDSGGILGVMALGASDPRVILTEDHVKLMRDIANVTASAVDKTRLFEKTQLRAAQLKALNDIARQLSTELADLDKLLQVITQNAVEIMGCEAGSLLLLDENGRDLVFRVVMGGGGENLIGKHISRESPSLVANAVNQVEPIIVNNPEGDARWHGEIDPDEERPPSQQFHSKALLTLPLVAQGQAVGALQLINKRGGGLFNQEDAEMANIFAGQAAIAIQNARLFETQDQQLLQRVQELEAMAQIDQELNQTVILDQLANVIMEIAIKQTKATQGALLLMDEENERLQVIASYNYAEDSILYKSEQTQLVAPDKGILGRVISSAKPAAIRVSDNDPQYEETVPGCKAQMAVPIIVGADTIGVVIVETVEDQQMGLLELNRLSRLVDRASSAVSNALLYSRLAQQQKLRIDFMNDIAHELKKPISAVKGYTELIQRGVVGDLTAQQAEFLNRVHRNADALEHLLNDIRDMGTMDAGQRLQLKLEPVDFNSVLDECLQTVQQDFAEKEQKIVVKLPEGMPEIWAERRRVVQIMLNFLTNANKYTPEEGVIEVVAEAVRNTWDPEGAQQVLHIAIKDNGLGISEADQKRLFEQYFRSTNEQALKESGTGLGLALTRRLILAHGGILWFESKLNEGTTFHFTIPLATEVMPSM